MHISVQHPPFDRILIKYNFNWKTSVGLDQLTSIPLLSRTDPLRQHKQNGYKTQYNIDLIRPSPASCALSIYIPMFNLTRTAQ